ncbi:MAG TPA: lipoyl synthase [Clostridiaceae bacterium]|nr:lipoyl synthase [Clostridiaceae bacterium]
MEDSNIARINKQINIDNKGKLSADNKDKPEVKRKPDWLRIRVHGNYNFTETENVLRSLSLNTVCEEANCPNRLECFNKRTATFMILGRTCTRNCTFCNVEKNVPEPVNPQEPENVAKAVAKMKLKHVVVTSVTRDDLPDGGAGHFARVIEEIKRLNGEVIIEVLIPDFKGDEDALLKVIKAKPHIINHNVETVPSLYHEVRPLAVYERSLRLLSNVKKHNPGIYTKSGIMLGLGEKREEVIEVLKDLRKADCDLLTIGQYLAPSKKHHPVIEYIHPDVFEEYKKIGYELGFKYVASAPLVRSSYHAQEAFNDLLDSKHS